VACRDDEALVKFDTLEVESLLVQKEPRLNEVEREKSLLGRLDDPLLLLL
jgi:hypothetical protein